MRRHLVVTLAFLPVLAILATLAGSPVPASAQDGGRTLRWSPPPADMVAERKWVREFSYTLVIRDSNRTERHRADFEHMQAIRKWTRVLELDDRAPVRSHVRYEDFITRRVFPGRPPVVVNEPLEGAGFVMVNRTGTKNDTVACTLDGKGVPGHQLRILRWNNDLGTIPPLANLFDGRTIRVGDRIDVDPEQGKAIYGDEFFQSASFRYTGTRPVDGIECLVFDADVNGIQTLNNGSTLGFRQKGELALRAGNLWPVHSILEGTVTVSGQSEHPQLGTLDFGGGGKVRTGSRYSYEKQPVPDEPGIRADPAKVPMPTMYDFTVRDIDGREVRLADYKGKVVMIVNGASKDSRYTAQYHHLQALARRFAGKLTILVFPCNDFGGCEPDSADQIKAYCRDRFGDSFRVMEKTVIDADGRTSPLFEFLRNSTGLRPTWNFYRYMVDADGHATRVWTPESLPDEPSAIEYIGDVIAGRHRDADGD